jgi:predicted AAA+ superfamily ATPase
MRALASSPVVLLNGARQTGKSTLAREVSNRHTGARYYTLDDAAILSAIDLDPQGFLGGIDGPMVLDEIQLAPKALRAIKLEVDRARQPGRFLLTGSANPMLLPKLSDALVGRMEVVSLYPFSQGEWAGRPERFVDLAFAPGAWPQHRATMDRNALLQAALRGGYPEMLTRTDAAQRRDWFASYLTTVLHRDVRQIAQIEQLAQMPRLLSLLAARSMGLLNVQELSSDAGLAHATLKRYLSLLMAVMLVHLLPPWFGNVSKRLIKTPKVMLTDTGLLGHLLALDARGVDQNPAATGRVLENFVGAELLKQIGWAQRRCGLHYYRTAARHEVDFVLEDDSGQLVGIEVKASAALGDRDVRGLLDLAQTAGRRFVRGLILYGGEQTIPFASNIHATPIDSLWAL